MNPETAHSALRKTASAGLIACSLFAAACANDPSPLPLVGTLERERMELVAEFQETIVELNVIEGERVQAGQLLMRQDGARVDQDLKAAEAAVTRTRQRLAELVRGPREEAIRAARARLDGAREILEVSTREHLRVQDLAEQNIASQTNVDRALRAVEIARTDVEALGAVLEDLLDGATVEELGQAEAAVDEAQARLERLRISAQRLEIVAPRNGRVEALPYELGERPPPGATLAVMLAGDTLHARVYVPEPLRARVKPGLAARIRVDGLENEIEGSVTFISSEAAFTPYFSLTQRDRSRLAYLAKVSITEGAYGDLPVGQPVEVDFPSLR
ncbi:MAG: HlyD family efflux transporter periplasmic adaptor subunit [Gammaproteobacteria bacterium]|nr:HlyD family efflux transporter periplasmic adaptor subunit [Gammaproteobacteria bacterium]